MGRDSEAVTQIKGLLFHRIEDFHPWHDGYLRVSTTDQHIEKNKADILQLANHYDLGRVVTQVAKSLKSERPTAVRRVGGREEWGIGNRTSLGQRLF